MKNTNETSLIKVKVKARYKIRFVVYLDSYKLSSTLYKNKMADTKT